jgi:Arc/MetJ family transcription regulator
MLETVFLDDDFLREAQEFTGLTEPAAILREALRALIQREADRRHEDVRR